MYTLKTHLREIPSWVEDSLMEYSTCGLVINQRFSGELNVRMIYSITRPLRPNSEALTKLLTNNAFVENCIAEHQRGDRPSNGLMLKVRGSS